MWVFICQQRDMVKNEWKHLSVRLFAIAHSSVRIIGIGVRRRFILRLWIKKALR